ncbi:MAG: carbohydrate deacetylase [Defluviitaleaceae bacterium]|nr:carbohydrate deacetylase [Defluviitaleaceae bacterium]
MKYILNYVLNFHNLVYQYPKEQGAYMTRNKKLVINADDFGYTPGVTYGIIEAYKNGIVSSTTALTVSNHFFSAMEAAQKLCPMLPIGLHLTLTLNGAKPILPKEQVPSLVDADGFFLKLDVFEQKVSDVSTDEIYMEWEAQFSRFLESGQEPSHLDSHHYVHSKNQKILEVALRLAKNHDLPLRAVPSNEGNSHLLQYYNGTKTTDELLPQFYGAGANFENLKEMIDYICESQNHFFEINVHPAFLDAPLQEYSSYSQERVEELKILTSEQAKRLLEKPGLVLTDFGHREL